MQMFLAPIPLVAAVPQQKESAPALRSWSIGEMSPDPGGLPRTWLKSLIPIGFLLLGLQGVAESLRLRWKLMHGDEQQPMSSNNPREETICD